MLKPKLKTFNKANRAVAVTTAESEDNMFIYKVQFVYGETAEVLASRDTLILLETLIRYGIIKKITVKS